MCVHASSECCNCYVISDYSYFLIEYFLVQLFVWDTEIMHKCETKISFKILSNSLLQYSFKIL